MKKASLFLFLSLFFCVPLLAQEKQDDAITLKNGEVYRGEIVLKTEDIVMLKMSDGKRYQFQLKEIEKIGKETAVPNTETKLKEQNEGNFAGILNAGGGMAFASSIPIGATPIIDFSLAFGTRKPFGINAFLGVGAGYEMILPADNGKGLSYIPVFVQSFIPLNDNKISPAFTGKAGYKFALNEEYAGGVFLSISGGINYRISERSSLYAGLFGQTQRISGTVIENNELGEFTKQGNAPINSIGLKIAFLF